MTRSCRNETSEMFRRNSHYDVKLQVPPGLGEGRAPHGIDHHHGSSELTRCSTGLVGYGPSCATLRLLLPSWGAGSPKPPRESDSSWRNPDRGDGMLSASRTMKCRGDTKSGSLRGGPVAAVAVETLTSQATVARAGSSPERGR